MITSYDIFGIYKTSKQYLSENNGRFEEEYSHEIQFNFSLYQYIPCKYDNLAIVKNPKVGNVQKCRDSSLTVFGITASY